MKNIFLFVTLFNVPFCLIYSQELSFVITKPSTTTEIICDTTDPFQNLMADALLKDINRISNHIPEKKNRFSGEKSIPIFIGTINSMVMQDLEIQNLINVGTIKHKWEVFTMQYITIKGVPSLIICGSDNRGMAYGVFHLSELMGVSPWYWWADVHPEKKDTISIFQQNFMSGEPSVKYRGIFLNDEDWGLQPWSAKTFESEVGDIGPRTYSKIFEL